ncbi:SDR family NAD(P)-dependent oxidoreductase [Jeotgalibaca porci]|uniref:SDR family NAD(P)-dependent oxidoreductase n=1 Tax=Jeotgalibaca porci TaxID=1868793 RepID=UPI0035A08066
MFWLTRKRKIVIIIVVDTFLIMLSHIIGYVFMEPFVTVTSVLTINVIILSVILYLIWGSVFKVFTRINRYTNLNEIFAIFSATSLVLASNLLVLTFYSDEYSRRLEIFTYLLSTLLIITSRLAWRLYTERRNHRNHRAVDPKEMKKIIIIGAGEGGRILSNSLISSKTANEIEIIGFVDDDPNKQNIYLSGIKVLGKTKDLPSLIKKYEVDTITLAVPSITRKKMKSIFDLLENEKVKVNTMPSMEELASGKVSISRLKNIDVVDLLGREEVKLDIEQIKDQLTNKVILVTGAGGSIGSEICRQVMQFNPKTLLLLGHGENSIYLIERELRQTFASKTTKIIPVIADVQDRERMMDVMAEHQPQIVYHAAAHKHVPLMEANPRESVKNNVYGTKNVAEAAKAAGVAKFVMVSTDKANNPPNVMGATKRIAELIVTGLNENSQTKFSAVRFGNVLGSRGSVIPVFREQIAKGGPITITDFRMTRYFMTIPEASRLVIQSGALASGGEIFVLDMGEPVKIVDLAKNMIQLSGYTENEIKIVESGIRPGEKLYEELLLDEERNDQQVFDKIFVGNIKGAKLEEVIGFVENLSEDDRLLAKEVVAFANR